jgi:hypothetical protein
MMEWLDGLNLPIKPPPPDFNTTFAIRAWNLMNGELNWQALDAVSELLGITDIELLLAQLETIKEHGQQSNTD